MKKSEPPRYLVSGEYIGPRLDGCDRERAAARRVLIRAVHRLVPRFFRTLQKDVYPTFVRAAGNGRIRLEPWKRGPDELKSHLLNWARQFNAHREEWILAGAVDTLHYWHRYPGKRTILDYSAFCKFVVESGWWEPRTFVVEPAWDPTFVRADAFAAGAMKAFESALTEYIRDERKRACKQGLKPARLYTPEHFEWLALFQFANFKLEEILARCKATGRAKASSQTISAGVHRAAALAGLTLRR
jgi:hypothetical protein